MVKIECFPNGTGAITVPKDFFESACIIEAASEFTNDCHFSFDVKDSEIMIFVSGKKGPVSVDFLGIFADRLIDHQAWREMDKEFSYIRDQIVEQAFAPLKRNAGL